MASEAPEVQSAEQGPLAEQVDERGERADWRSSIAGTLLITLLIGAWLIVSIAVLEYAEPLNTAIWGALIVFLALLRLLGPVARSRTLALATILAGALTTVSGFVLEQTGGPTANLALMGAAVAVLATVGLAAASEDALESRP